MDTIKFKDAQREGQRQEKLVRMAGAPKKVFKKKVESWSVQKQVKEKRDVRKVKKDKRRIAMVKKAALAVEAAQRAVTKDAIL